jgi:hypothetical protein
MAALARTLLFVSEATRDDFLRRYGERFRAKAIVLPHGLLPIAPDVGRVDYAPRAEARGRWCSGAPSSSYKGVELFAELARSPASARAAWPCASSAVGCRARAAAHGAPDARACKSTTATSTATRSCSSLSENAVFLLPYRDASQSGALYALLNHGCLFVCADAGDLGAFMRRYGLEGLLLRERSAPAVLEALDHLAAHRDEVLAALREAQHRCAWTKWWDGFREARPSRTARWRRAARQPAGASAPIATFPRTGRSRPACRCAGCDNPPAAAPGRLSHWISR